VQLENILNHNPLALATQYKQDVLNRCAAYIKFAAKRTGNRFEQEDLDHLAQAAIWFTAKNNPKNPTPMILDEAVKLCNSWIREDGNLLLRNEVAKYRKVNYDRKPKSLRYDPSDYQRVVRLVAEQTVELESEVWYWLDQIIMEWGIHFGIWIILLLSLKESKMSLGTLIEQYFGFKPDPAQTLSAYRLQKKVKEIYSR
jgi:hypothetical protein